MANVLRAIGTYAPLSCCFGQDRRRKLLEDVKNPTVPKVSYQAKARPPAKPNIMVQHSSPETLRSRQAPDVEEVTLVPRRSLAQIVSPPTLKRNGRSIGAPDIRLDFPGLPTSSSESSIKAQAGFDTSSESSPFDGMPKTTAVASPSMFASAEPLRASSVASLPTTSSGVGLSGSEAVEEQFEKDVERLKLFAEEIARIKAVKRQVRCGISIQLDRSLDEMLPYKEISKKKLLRELTKKKKVLRDLAQDFIKKRHGTHKKALKKLWSGLESEIHGSMSRFW